MKKRPEPSLATLRTVTSAGSAFSSLKLTSLTTGFYVIPISCQKNTSTGQPKTSIRPRSKALTITVSCTFIMNNRLMCIEMANPANTDQSKRGQIGSRSACKGIVGESSLLPEDPTDVDIPIRVKGQCSPALEETSKLLRFFSNLNNSVSFLFQNPHSDQS